MITPARKPFTAGPFVAAAGSVFVAVALIVCLFLAVGIDPLTAAGVIWKSTFGSLRTFGEGLVRATPLLMIAATLLPSLRAGLYNIGAPGQLGAGALATTLVALAMPGASGWTVIPLCAAASILAGGATALIPGVLKARWRVNEIMSTLAMNFIVGGVTRLPSERAAAKRLANLPQSPSLPRNSALPLLISGTRAHIGLLVALVFIPALLLMDRSLLGYRLRLFSVNPVLAKRAGVGAASYVTWLITFGGAGAGLAGWMQVAAIDHRLYITVAGPVGYPACSSPCLARSTRSAPSLRPSFSAHCFMAAPPFRSEPGSPPKSSGVFRNSFSLSTRRVPISEIDR